MIILALVVAFGYQIWSRGKSTPKKTTKIDEDSMDDFINKVSGGKKQTPDQLKRIDAMKD
jgi:predicted negative regulator of RcsB-dependent stress response